MCDERQLSEALAGLNDKDMRTVEELARILAEKQVKTAELFHISGAELTEIESGKRAVSRVVYRGAPNGAFGWLIVRRAATAALLVLLICCVGIAGFADSMRTALLSIFHGPIATRVKTITYENEPDMTGLYLPQLLLDGYRYDTHTRATGSDLLHVVYTNEEGKRIDYYYYPQGADASYDNEHTLFSQIGLSHGTGYVARSDTLTMLFFPMDTAYVQMDFEDSVSDAELKAIAESVRWVP